MAGHKLYEGQVTEGLAIVAAARERYNGLKKSPWDEIECGDYYARAMSSWSLLLGAQGYAYDGPAQRIAFRPRVGVDRHRSLFTAAEGWGRFDQRREGQEQANALSVHGGRCELGELRSARPGRKSASGKVEIGDKAISAEVKFDAGDALVRLSKPVTLKAGEAMVVTLIWA